MFFLVGKSVGRYGRAEALYKIKICFPSRIVFTTCKFEKKMKQPFKFDLCVLNFESMKVNCEIAEKLSASGIELMADSSIGLLRFQRRYPKIYARRSRSLVYRMSIKH